MRVRDMSQLVLRVDPAIKQWLESKAKKEERSQNWLISKTLKEAMERDKQAKHA